MRYKTKALITLSIIVQLINSTTDQINLEGRKHKRKREEQLNTPQKMQQTMLEPNNIECSALNTYQPHPSTHCYAENTPQPGSSAYPHGENRMNMMILNRGVFKLPRLRVNEFENYGLFKNVSHEYYIMTLLEYKSNRKEDSHNLRRDFNFQNTGQYTSLYNSILDSNDIEKARIKFVLFWQKENTKNIWILVKELGDCITERLYVIADFLINAQNSLYKKKNTGFYSNILQDLVEYIIKHGPYWYSFKEVDIYNHNVKKHLKRKETIGDIWIKKRINPYYCLRSLALLDENNYKNTEAEAEAEADVEADVDLKLKKALTIILYIPEVYEDMRLISNENVKNIGYLILQERHALNNNLDENTIDTMVYMISIVSYLIGVTQKNQSLEKNSFSIIKHVLLDRKGINISDTYSIFNLVFESISLFYYYSTEVVYMEKKWVDSLRCLNDRKYMFLPADDNHYLLGADFIMYQKYIEFKIEMSELEAGGQDIRFMYKDAVFLNKVPLSILDHYHVQFVNNTTHSIQMIHLPIYIHQNGSNIKMLVYIHKIRDIILHIHTMLNSNPLVTVEPKKHVMADSSNVLHTNIYPFKFNPTTNTWSIIPHGSEDMNKTIKKIEDEGYYVVFYLIEEDILTTNFILAEFDFIKIKPDELQHKDRQCAPTSEIFKIPIFLSYLFISSTTFSNYSMENRETSHFAKDKSYTDLVPLKITYIHVTKLDDKTSEGGKDLKNFKIYYPDFIIRASDSKYEDIHCYSMNTRVAFDNDIYSIAWLTQIQKSINEYTIYEFNNRDIDQRENNSKYPKKLIYSFMETAINSDSTIDMVNYGICLYKTANNMYSSSPIFCNTIVSLFDILKKDSTILNDIDVRSKTNDYIKLDKILKSPGGLIFIKSTNYRLTNYGLHGEILDILTHSDV
ncbi:hypothetical protein NEQG_00691 [Nematocida parisii ERTm3]|uniref:Uncharacterized protein n=2 Tax=Nematocida parisii TaxID=586133 RepID=I3EI25_NEMP3|nr:hypothetical protein NEQG_00691 [Nematocida parisii ERTm3]